MGVQVEDLVGAVVGTAVIDTVGAVVGAAVVNVEAVGVDVGAAVAVVVVVKAVSVAPKNTFLVLSFCVFPEVFRLGNFGCLEILPR